tara:strand:+ start:413 stop:694 length:282 start_codon:yes stop_codon:yes gene_type:complete
LSRSEIIKKLKEKNPKLNLSQLEIILETFCQDIQNSLKKGIKFEIRGFGTFFTKKIKEKFSARNPASGKLIYVPEKKKVRFRASKKLKAFVNK